jgi:hypothetical protein
MNRILLTGKKGLLTECQRTGRTAGNDRKRNKSEDRLVSWPV